MSNNTEIVTIALDFDGTVVENVYPDMGKDVPLAANTLRILHQFGYKIILYTMRSGDLLDFAVEWFKERKIPLYGIQFDPTQHEWSSSNKCYADLIIDDRAFGCPLIKYESFERPVVNWVQVANMLLHSKYEHRYGGGV